jgi:hypothetical protein
LLGCVETNRVEAFRAWSFGYCLALSFLSGGLFALSLRFW